MIKSGNNGSGKSMSLRKCRKLFGVKYFTWLEFIADFIISFNLAEL